ncbi:MAG: 1-deoxy-D-xylulose-5-phosphate synthase N-terminal domain-containing protein, partial [Parachlamydiaceae bacterium]
MILEKLTSLKDLKALSIDELNELANEIRERIIQVMSVNGGHLGSNLGAIELTIALHKVFDSPTDKFIWDVSHQTYTHK